MAIKLDCLLSSSFLSSMPPSIFNQTRPVYSFPPSPLVPLLRVCSSARIGEKHNTPTSMLLKITPTASSAFPRKSTTKPHEKAAILRLPKKRSGRDQPSLATLIFNPLDYLINNFIDRPIRPSVDPSNVLAGNFAPVDEHPPTNCESIEGSPPACLHGTYIRNGPNPQYLPRGPYHLFDGDGMLHSIKISQGKATFCSRYVKTYKYTTERKAGAPIVPSVFSGFNSLSACMTRGALWTARVLTGQFDPANGIGVANTSLAFFGGCLFALGESDLPYALRLTSCGDIETVGRHDFDGKLSMNMTAHPKIDHSSGETFAFRCGFMPPFLTYFRFDRNGNKKAEVPIFSMHRPSLVHDFAISKKYAIFCDIHIGMNVRKMILGRGLLVSADPTKVPRLGIIPRYATDSSEMRWFDVPGLNFVHAINAWDEVDAVVLLAPNVLAVEHALDTMELVHCLVEKVTINLKTGTVTRKQLSARNLDFAVINPSYVGKKNRFVYAAMGDPMPKISALVKLDVSKAKDEAQDCIVASRIYGPRCYGGEPFFVAREPDNPEAEEDDGYLVTYVHDEIAKESKFLVMDAKSPHLEIVASVKLPGRVPYGFHGLFIRESDLKKQSEVQRCKNGFKFGL